MDDVLKDKNIKSEAIDFVSDLTKREKVLQGVLDLLLAVVRNPVFIQESKDLGTRIVVANANDRRVEEELKQLVLRVLKSYEVQVEVQELIKQVFSSQTATGTLVRLLLSAVGDPAVQGALANAVKYSFRELLHDQETVEQFKLFGEYLLHEFEKDVEKDRIVSVLEMKGIGLDRRERDLAFLGLNLQREGGDDRPTN